MASAPSDWNHLNRILPRPPDGVSKCVASAAVSITAANDACVRLTQKPGCVRVHRSRENFRNAQSPRFVNATIGVIRVTINTMIQILPASRL